MFLSFFRLLESSFNLFMIHLLLCKGYMPSFITLLQILLTKIYPLRFFSSPSRGVLCLRQVWLSYPMTNRILSLRWNIGDLGFCLEGIFKDLTTLLSSNEHRNRNRFPRFFAFYILIWHQNNCKILNHKSNLILFLFLNQYFLSFLCFLCLLYLYEDLDRDLRLSLFYLS